MISGRYISVFQDLKTPINDVNRLDKILKRKYKFTTNKLINPSRRDVLKQINEYAKSLSKSDNLIIYFAIKELFTNTS